MSDLIILDLLPAVLLLAAIILVVYLRSNSRRNAALKENKSESFEEKFRKIFFSTLSGVITGDDLDKSISAIADGIKQTFGTSIFIFKRDGESAAFVCHAADDLDLISSVLLKYGIRLDLDNIPLRGGRYKIFRGNYYEFTNPFPLIGDVATSAACRKIQKELKFGLIATNSVKTESGDYLIVLLLQEKVHDGRIFVGQFGTLLNSAVHVSNLKRKIVDLERRLDDQLNETRKEFIDREDEHTQLYENMPIPAALLNETGVILQANRALRDLLGNEVLPIGEPFSSLIADAAEANFAESLFNVKIKRQEDFALVTSEKHFKGRLLYLGDRKQIAVYLLDDTSAASLSAELERTRDALRRESESKAKLVEERERGYEELVSSSLVPEIAVLADKVQFASESARQIFSVENGCSVEDFATENEISTLSTGEPIFEVKASGERAFSVLQWESSGYRFFTFIEVTQFRKAEEDLRRSALQSENLFNGILPVARAREGKIVEWNERFGNLQKEFLDTEKSFDDFVSYLGESPEGIRQELSSNRVIAKTCLSTDGKSFNIRLISADDSVTIFLEETTQLENLKEQLQESQNLLSSSIGLFSDEPIFVMKNGKVTAANGAAKVGLALEVDESFDVDSLFASLGVSDRIGPVKLKEDFFRIESVTLDGLTVFHLRKVTGEISQREEIGQLNRQTVLLEDLANSEQYENILIDLKEIIGGDRTVKSICTGVIYSTRGTGDVYSLEVGTDKIDQSVALGLGPSDSAIIESGGIFSKDDYHDSPFGGVISPEGSTVAIETVPSGDDRGFASVAFASREAAESFEKKSAGGIANLLKTAASVAAGIHFRSSARNKAEESSKTMQAIVDLFGVYGSSLGETAQGTVDLLRQVLGAESVGLYSIEGASMRLSVRIGEMPEVVQVADIHFGTVFPASQLVGDSPPISGTGEASANEICFSVGSREQRFALICKFKETHPSPLELNVVSAVALDLLESREKKEEQLRKASDLLGESRSIIDFMTAVSKAGSPEDVVRILGDSLVRQNKDSSITVLTDADAQTSVKPLEVTRKSEGEFAICEANFSDFGIGLVRIKTSSDLYCETMVDVAVDRLRSFVAARFAEVRREPEAQQPTPDVLASDSAGHEKSTDEVLTSSVNELENEEPSSEALAVQDDERKKEEVEAEPVPASEEVLPDPDISYADQDAIFQGVRASVTREETTASRIKNFSISVLAEFKAELPVAELIEDIFVNFIAASGIPDCDVLMMTAGPTPNETETRIGKHIRIRLTSTESVSPNESLVKQNEGIRASMDKIEESGYRVAVGAYGNELTMDVCETAKIQTS